MDNTDRGLLRLVTTSPGWRVILDLMEAECDKAERELLAAPVNDRETVIAFHNRAQAFRMFFERFQKNILRELQNEENHAPEMTPEEIIRAQVLG